ncbi:indole-3-glycerol-phosphate synthase [Candidatus Micrarchaeota archaeon]|nr:indole-3-glycerol-phosphate synthase [Candidatus Micrarchaeota archaeon]
MDILDRFIENAKISVAEGYYDEIAQENVKRISLKNRIEEQFTVIAEIKHASPSGEYSYREIDAEKTAKDFLESGADAISVVVEPKIFRGKLSNVPLAKKAGLPVLFKDFVFSDEQLNAAAGADCVLLVVKVIDRLELDLDEMINKAHENNLEVLLESYDENEMKRAMETDADILGINNRDLQTLTVDIKRTEKILELVGETKKPVISESGIKNADDVRTVKKAGVKGVLVGTAIWKANDIQSKIRELKEGGASG